MTCHEIQQALEALSDPAAPAAAELDAKVGAHLLTCPACSAYAARLERDDAVLAEVLSAPGRDSDLAAHRRAVASKIKSFEVRRGWSRRAWVATAAAAMLALTAWGVVNFVNPKTSEVAQADPVPHVGPITVQDHSEEALSARVTKLQATVRDKQVLDELEQLQETFENSGDGEAKSLTEDAELYVERILALDVKNPDQMREILSGIHSADIKTRLEKLRDSLSDDAPAPLQDSLKLAAATLSEASELGADHAQ